MSNLTDFFPLAEAGGGLTPKYREFNSSSSFTPSQALIDAGGYIEVLVVGAGGRGASSSFGGNGGEAIIKRMNLTSRGGCTVSIGGGVSSSGTGGSSVFYGASAGGFNVSAKGGTGDYATGQLDPKSSPSWGSPSNSGSSGPGVFGFGAGGGYASGVRIAKPNTGQGCVDGTSGSGYCLIKWYE